MYFILLLLLIMQAVVTYNYVADKLNGRRRR